jgi:hypothetical protein
MDDYTLAGDLFHLLRQSASLGLHEKDYQHEFVTRLHAGNFHFENRYDSIAAELRLTDAALHIIHDIVYGNTFPSIGYNGLNYSPDCVDIVIVLQMAIGKRQLSFLPVIIEPRTQEYAAVKEKINRFNNIISDSSFKEIKITSAKVTSTNKPLLAKLFQLGFTDSIEQKISDSALKRKVREAQKLFNLLSDGVLRSTSLAERTGLCIEQHPVVVLYKAIEKSNSSQYTLSHIAGI